jgi:hypothetical protein
MWWIIGIAVFLFVMVFVLALCKSAGDYDRSVEEAFERDKAAKSEDAGA